MILRADVRSLPFEAASVDLVITSPPYFALRSYRDADEHYQGQIGSEATPKEFLRALWACTREMVRVLKPSGSIFVNLGDKYAGSGGHNNSNLGVGATKASGSTLRGGKQFSHRAEATRRNAPDRYNQESDGIKAKSLLGLPWRYAIGCTDDLGLILRAEIVWSKPNGLPESVTDRVRRSHENWFHFVKEPRYFSAVDEIRESYAPASRRRYESGFAFDSKRPQAQLTKGTNYRDGDTYSQNPLGKLPGSVWSIPTEPLIVPEWAKKKFNLSDHFAAFPQEWPRRIILGWAPDGGLVLDPFCGTGTVPMVAKALGRIGIGVDLSAGYCRLARWRMTQSMHWKKSEQRTLKEAQGELAT